MPPVSAPGDLETGSHAKGTPLLWRPPLRLVSWNIERGYRPNDIAGFVRDFGADICLFQEVDRNARRTGNRHVADFLANNLQFSYAMGIAFKEMNQGPDAWHGQATLSRFPIKQARVLRFRYQSTFWKPRWFVPNTPPFQEREGGRIALMTEFDLGSRSTGRIIAYNLHLESRGPEDLRAAQLRDVLQDVSQLSRNTDDTIIIAGDFNTKTAQRSPCIELLRQAGFRDAIGRPQQYTTSRGGALAGLFIDGAIDWIWIRGPVSISQAEVHTRLRVSDHFPLTALLG